MGNELTKVEQSVARQVALGRTNHEVAEALQISEKTVEWNLTKVYRKLGVRSRTELALRGVAVHEDGARAREGSGKDRVEESRQ